MRVLVDARIGWGHGIGRVIANLVPRVARLRPAWQFDALVSSADLSRAQEAFAGVPNLMITPCDIRPFSLREQVALPRLARRADLTWFTNYWTPLAWSGPFVTTVHDLLHLYPELAPAARLNRWLARLTFGKVRRAARAVMFDSRFTEAEFRRIVGAPRHGVTVPLGGDHLRFADRQGAKERLMLIVAAPKRHKNFAMALEAWRRVRLAPGWRLAIVAPSSEAMRSSIDLDALVRSSDDVELHRGIDNDALTALFERSAIVLTPSRYEGFGLPLLEGLLAGALCVSASAGASVEVAEGSFVHFVNADDVVGWAEAIEQASVLAGAGDPALATVLEHNRQRAARFRWDHTAAQAADILDMAAG